MVQHLERRELLSITPAAITITPVEAQSFQGTVATFIATDAGPFSASIAWGDGTTSAGTVTASAAGGYSVEGTHTYAEDGRQTVSVSIVDAFDSSTATAASTADVGEGAFILTITPTEGHTFSGAVASFTDERNPLQTVGNFSATIDWGDGKTTAGTVTGPTGGPFTINGSHAYAEDGTFTVVATFSDEPPSTLTNIPITSSAVVSESDLTVTAGAAISATEGVAQSGITVATFSDPGSTDAASDYAATINWGDGATTAGLVSGSGGHFTVTGDHTYAEDGVYPVTVTVTENGVTQQGSAASATAFATVSESDATLTARSISVAEGHSFTGQVALLSDPGSTDPASFYTVEINWGDGSTGFGTVSGANGSYTATGTHTYADDGRYTIGLSASEGGAPPSPIATATALADVAEDDITVTAQAIQTAEKRPINGTIATFTDPTAAQGDLFTAVVNWGDGSSSTATVTGAAGSYTINGSHTYAEDGRYTMTVTVAETEVSQQGAAASSTALATVNENDATLTAINISSGEGKLFAGQLGVLTDPGSTDDSTAFNVIVNWGDGTTSAATLSGTGGVFTVAGSHTYAEDGTYAISMTASGSPSEGLIAAAAGTATVAEDDITVTAIPVQGVENTAFSGAVATFTDPTATAADVFTAEINWGDGVTNAGTVSLNSGVFTVSGTHTYGDDGQYPLGVSVQEKGVNQAGGSQVASAVATIANSSPQAAWADNAFEDLLGREIDPGSMTDFVVAQQAGVSRSALSLFITGSDEYLTGEIDRAYAQFLDRVADPLGQAFWLAQMRSGVSYEQLEAAFIASPEYYQVAGGTDRAFVDKLYFDLLGRQPDAAGENFWVQALAAGESRFDVALGFTTSNERESIVIGQDYVNLLHRQGTPQEIANWVSAYDAGLSNEDIAAEFVASDEYFHVVGQD